MIAYFSDMLYDSDLDLRLSEVVKDPAAFTVRSRLAPPRIALGLLFGIPCLVLLTYALRQQGIYFLLALLFCPPMAILGSLFGLARQQKTFIPGLGKAVKSFRILHIQRDLEVPLPRQGVLAIYKRWSSGGGEIGGGCYLYHAEIEGLRGFGFCVSKDEKRRDEFAGELAEFLRYEVRYEGDR